ncbi:MAG: hypothetical protein KJZ85_08050 [Rhodobacteraceae bacterium]|jgi:hypothetical protein|nr:hypothetical protein [Paracoccaceae bacterium]
MTAGTVRGFAAAVAVVLAAAAAGAQESSNVVATQTDWSVFVEESPKECWAVSAPKEWAATDRSDRPTSVRRGDIRFFVAYRPGGARGEIAYTGGYPFAEGSTVTVEIGDARFELFTDGEWAWPASPEEDARLMEAMRRGQQAIVTARSGRGNNTRDIFSLLGFTAATTEAERRCPAG